MDAHKPYVQTLFLSGNASVGEKFVMLAPTGGRIVKAVAYAQTPPATTNILIDVEINGNSVWANANDRITITPGAFGFQNTGVAPTPALAKFVEGARISVDVDQVGTGTTGANIAVSVVIAFDY